MNPWDTTGPSKTIAGLRRAGLRDNASRRAIKKLQQGVQRTAGSYVLAPIASLRHLGPTKAPGAAS